MKLKSFLSAAADAHKIILLARFYFVLVVIGLWGFTLQAQTLEVPFLAGRVNDNAGLLAASARETIEALLKAHEDSTSNQVVVLIISSLQGETLEDYSIKVAETWKLGQKDKDNGVLLLIAQDDRKVRIEVGDGLEGSLPDITCGHIIRREIVPRFRDSDYAGGVRAGVEAILGAIAGSYQAEAESGDEPDLKFRILFFSIFLVVVGTFTTIGLVSPGAVGWMLYFFLIPFWSTFPMISLGVKAGVMLLAGYLAGYPLFKFWFGKTKKGKALAEKMKAAAKTKSASGRSYRSGGASGGWSWSSGSSSGGGFSGGGGSFSGGGSSGSW